MSRIKDLYAEVEQIDDLQTGGLEMAHQAYLIRKETIINKLKMLAADTEYPIYRDTILEAVKFIEEGEV